MQKEEPHPQLSQLGNVGNGHDPFDPERLRLSQDFESMVGVERVLTTVPVRKPSRQDFIRVHPGANYRIDTTLLELKEDQETYLVDPALRSDLPGEVVAKTLFTTINRQNVVFLWPVRLPGADGRLDAWNRSAFAAAALAMTRWVRVASNKSLGAYEVLKAPATLPEPEFPEVDLRTLLEIAFHDRYIQSFDHPVLRRLRGEI